MLEKYGEEFSFVDGVGREGLASQGVVGEDPVRKGGCAGGAKGRALEEELGEESGLDESHGAGDGGDIEARGVGRVNKEKVQDIAALFVADSF